MTAQGDARRPWWVDLILGAVGVGLVVWADPDLGTALRVRIKQELAAWRYRRWYADYRRWPAWLREAYEVRHGRPEKPGGLG